MADNPKPSPAVKAAVPLWHPPLGAGSGFPHPVQNKITLPGGPLLGGPLGGAGWGVLLLGYGWWVTDDAVLKRPRFLTVEQVAEELNVGLPMVRGLLKSGDLRGIQVGAKGSWRIGTRDLEDYIAQAYRVTAERIAAGELPDEA